ncbi:zinc dependent phospholipase C family protein [Wukongibacter baidiensis]|uniref:zinc dependent phospholipase C family protein n=1 Tax=Wukongibacter baidiensis TaxID=1723361 RepID=UPI003D7F1C01
MNSFEKTYGSILQYTFTFLNPFKKTIIKTHCNVHKFINIQGLRILKNDNCLSAYEFFTLHIHQINEGAYWADQDFKSSSHLYNPYTKRGLFGRKNAMDLAIEYYNKAEELFLADNENKAMFYLGAALHIIQDLTIPQHANVRLLDNHRQYETFVKRTYQYINSFKATDKAYILDTTQEYVRFNARVALKIYRKFKDIKEKEARYYKIASCTLPLAQRTTAGCMLTFYENVIKKKLA